MNAFHSALESLGLSQKEIDAYLLLLQMGTSAASILGRRLKIPPSTAQYTCQQLTKKGLVRMVQRSNTYLFSAEPPRKLMALVAEERSKIESKEKMVEEMVTELEKVMNPNPVMPKVRFFEGYEGVIDAYEELIEDIEGEIEVQCYVQPLELTPQHKRHKALIDRIQKTFVGKRVHTRILLPVSAQSLGYLKDEKKNLEEHRFVPDETFNCMPSEVILCKDKMYCLSSHGNFMFATIVQNEGIVAMQKGLFEMAWKHAKVTHEDALKKHGIKKKS